MILNFYIARLFYPRYWYLPYNVLKSQAILETGNFTSNIYKENNNYFGMKLPRIRKTHADGENRGHATFPLKIDSITDYFLWLEYNNIDYNGDPYAFMRKVQQKGFNPSHTYPDTWYKVYLKQ